MTIRQPAFATAVVLGLVLRASFAHAQGATDKDADAERLFNEAKTLMEAKKFAEACPKLESAYRKDQQQGTLLNLAYCHKEMGASWLSWVEFREAESKATDKQRKDFAREKMKELEKGLARVVVDPQSKYDLTEVDLEDKRIYDAEKYTPFYAEPAPQQGASAQRKVIFHAKGKKAAILLISVGSPKDKVIHVQVPEMAEEDPVVATPIAEGGSGAPQPSPSQGDNTSSWSGQKTLAVVMGAVGLGGVVIGSVFGVKTMTGSCADGTVANGGSVCTPDERSSASGEAAISTVAFAAGGALLTGAVVVWILAPSGSKTASAPPASLSATVGPSWAGLRGTF